jgi:hypothetical protein
MIAPGNDETVSTQSWLGISGPCAQGHHAGLYPSHGVGKLSAASATLKKGQRQHESTLENRDPDAAKESKAVFAKTAAQKQRKTEIAFSPCESKHPKEGIHGSPRKNSCH